MGVIMGFLNQYFNFYTMVLVVGSGLFSYFFDQNALKESGLQKEAKICKILGLTYIGSGILLYFVVLVSGIWY